MGIFGKEAIPIKAEYPALRHIWKLMTLDLVLLLAIWIIPVTEILTAAYSDGESAGFGDLSMYLVWTCRCLRLLSWVLMAVLLTREGFRKARVWYLLRMITFLLVQFSNGVSGYLDQIANPMLFAGNFTPSFAITLIFGTIITPLLLPFGNRRILKDTSEVLDYYGFGKDARANRRCGNVLAVFSGVLAGLVLILAVFLIRILSTTEYGLRSYLIAPDVSESVQLFLLDLILLILFAALGTLIFMGISARRMKCTYRLMKGLIE